MTEAQIQLMELETKITELETELMSVKNGENMMLQKLKELNQASKAELENSILKESLAVSAEKYATLKQEQDKSLMQIVAVVKELRLKINQIEDSNKILSNVIEKEISGLTDKVDRVVQNLDREIKSGLETKIAALDDAIQTSNKRNAEYFRRKYLIDRFIKVLTYSVPAYIGYMILGLLLKTFVK